MIKSMTGFGRGEYGDENRHFTVEVKSVNHRYLEPSIKLPRALSMFESNVRSVLKNYIYRGKVDLFVSYEDLSEKRSALHYNETLAGEYVKYFKQISDQFSLDYDIRTSTIGRCPDVFTLDSQSEDEEELWEGLQTALIRACEMLVQAREREGEALKADLIPKLEQMKSNVDQVELRYPAIVEAYRSRIREKVAELLGETHLDENRLAEQIVIFSDKVATDEETVRLRSHIDSMTDVLLRGGEAGRRLDFIAQEMNREANTILSKCNDLETSHLAIDLKTQIEKIREQVQNIE